MTSQELIEEILLAQLEARAAEYDEVDVRFSTEVTRLVAGGDPDDDHVEVVVRSRATGNEETLRGRALVAADGAASLIRGELGLQLEGVRELMHIVNCYFRADIERHLGERRGVLFFVSSEHATGVLQPLDGAGRWLCQIGVRPEEHSLDVFTKERARDWIRAAVGVDDLEPDVLSLGLWQLNSTVVERLVQGRVVLCGDAAHQFPPTGGLGVNTGLQGMHNVMWKLAYFVHGMAGWSLVETYDAERRGIAQAITSQSLENSVNVVRINAAAAAGTQRGFTAEQIVAESRRYGNHLGIELGAAYTSPAVVPDGTSPPAVEDPYTDYVPSAVPGCRAPHVWLVDTDDPDEPGRVLSTLDLFRSSFTLLAGPDGAAWRDAAAAARGELFGGQLTCHIVGGPLQDNAAFVPAYGIEPDGAVLVRPDGHVAWRQAHGPVDSATLVKVMRQILDR
jgi:2-polyprenyl-6-methoxyphenol hydroxylase-like FAD-dependent oxidoreductase